MSTQFSANGRHGYFIATKLLEIERIIAEDYYSFRRGTYLVVIIHFSRLLFVCWGLGFQASQRYD